MTIQQDNDDLTTKEQEFLDAWNKLYDKFGRPPSARRLAKELGYKSPNSITQFKEQLIDKGITLKQEDQ